MNRDDALLQGVELPAPELRVGPIDVWLTHVRDVRVVVNAPADDEPSDGRGYPRIKPVLLADESLRAKSYDPPSSACLAEFVRLADLPSSDLPDAVAEYASSWGPLGICRHGWLESHAQCRSMWWEPVEAWGRYSAHIAAVLRVSERLQKDLPGSTSDWQAILAVEPEIEPFIPDAGLDRAEAGQWEHLSEYGVHRFPDQFYDSAVIGEKRCIRSILEEWRRRGDVGLRVYWGIDEPTPSVRLTAYGLVGILATQLLATVSAPLYQCAGCQNAFTPPPGSRKPAKGRKAWCPDCGRHAQWREYQRRRYEAQQRGGSQ